MKHTTEARNEAERMVLNEAGGKTTLGLSMLLLMRATDLQSYKAVAIIRACRWASEEGNVPDEVIGTFYREDLKDLLKEDTR